MPVTINTQEGTITIPLEDYRELIQRVNWLECLEAAGVDNWDGYDYAQELYDD